MPPNQWEKLYVRMPKWLIRALDKGAEGRAMDRSEYIRHAVIECLKHDGVLPPEAHKRVQSEHDK